MNNKIPFKILPIALAGFIFFSCTNTSSVEKRNSDSIAMSEDSLIQKQFELSEMKTNWNKHAVALDSIHDGGPGKNDIPAIDFPEFVNVTDAHRFLTEPDFGILINRDGQQKFYPLKILNWHEVVNDVSGNLPVAITFCPLCGSAIVYNRIVDGDTLLFGVSGKLFESNMVMFDEKTESLWSQAMGESIAGDLTGKKLQLVNSAIISFEDLLKLYPAAKVLSINTGYERNYNEYAYADYNNNDELYFPVSKKSNQFENKDIVYAVRTANLSVAFYWKDLLKYQSATVNTTDGTVVVKVENFIPVAVIKESGKELNGYFSYWFSWYAVNGENGIVWNSKR
ncbi:MAG: DUF3179 domain-containing protein [Chitinophagales bacterium]|nr:DUF3179 domain-containing protein [Chitinophagales bacterium]